MGPLVILIKLLMKLYILGDGSRRRPHGNVGICTSASLAYAESNNVLAETAGERVAELKTHLPLINIQRMLRSGGKQMVLLQF